MLRVQAQAEGGVGVLLLGPLVRVALQGTLMFKDNFLEYIRMRTCSKPFGDGIRDSGALITTCMFPMFKFQVPGVVNIYIYNLVYFKVTWESRG